MSENDTLLLQKGTFVRISTDIVSNGYRYPETLNYHLYDGELGCLVSELCDDDEQEQVYSVVFLTTGRKQSYVESDIPKDFLLPMSFEDAKDLLSPSQMDRFAAYKSKTVQRKIWRHLKSNGVDVSEDFPFSGLQSSALGKIGTIVRVVDHNPASSASYQTHRVKFTQEMTKSIGQYGVAVCRVDAALGGTCVAFPDPINDVWVFSNAWLVPVQDTTVLSTLQLDQLLKLGKMMRNIVLAKKEKREKERKEFQIQFCLFLFLAICFFVFLPDSNRRVEEVNYVGYP